MRRVLIFLVSLATAVLVRGQDHILLMNGQIIDAKVIGQSTLEVRYALITGNKVKERAEPTESVFSVTDSLGVEKVWYFQDSLFGNEFSVQQMRHYIRGEQDARKDKRFILPMIGGFVTGAGLVIGFDMEIMALLIPPVYVGAMALPRVRVSSKSIERHPLMDGDNYYAYGYANAGKGKRIIRSLLSSAVGVAVGYGVNQLVIKPNRALYD